MRYLPSVQAQILGRVCSYANDAVGANQLDKGVSDRALGVALAISLQVSEVTDVSLLVRRSTVGLVVRVDYCYI